MTRGCVRPRRRPLRVDPAGEDTDIDWFFTMFLQHLRGPEGEIESRISHENSSIATFGQVGGLLGKDLCQ